MSRLDSAPKMEQKRNIFRGENLSEIAKKAKHSVPAIKPNCTAEVILPTAPTPIFHWVCRSPKMALPANQREVPENWENTIVGKIQKGILVSIFFK